jgi:hypothetical protein
MHNRAIIQQLVAIIIRNRDGDEFKQVAVVSCCACLASFAIFGLWLHGVITMGMGTATNLNGVTVGDW